MSQSHGQKKLSNLILIIFSILVWKTKSSLIISTLDVGRKMVNDELGKVKLIIIT